MAAILNVQQSELESTDTSNEIDSEQDMNQKANNTFDELLEMMKEKLKVSNKRGTIQILILITQF